MQCKDCQNKAARRALRLDQKLGLWLLGRLLRVLSLEIVVESGAFHLAARTIEGPWIIPGWAEQLGGKESDAYSVTAERDRRARAAERASKAQEYTFTLPGDQDPDQAAQRIIKNVRDYKLNEANHVH